MRPLRWPVHDDYSCCTKPVAWFDDYGSAVDYVNAATCNLYVGEPRYAKAQIVEVQRDFAPDNHNPRISV